MTYVQTLSQNIYKYRSLAIQALGASIVCLMCLYGYFVVGIIFNGSTIEHLENKISQESSNLGDLEAQYITRKNAVSLDEAYALGFVDIKNPVYISRGSSEPVALGN